MSPKWTKADVGRLRSAINSFFVCNRPLSSVPIGWADKFRAYLAEHRVGIVIQEIRSLRNLVANRAREYRETATHYETHPEVCGASTQEMVQRFTSFAETADRDVRRADTLIARVEAEGLPQEVIDYDPMVRT